MRNAGVGVALVIIMMGILGAYWVWPALDRAKRAYEQTLEDAERGEVRVEVGAVIGSTLFAAMLVITIAMGFAS